MSKALLYAAINGHKDATELLLLHGAMPIYTKCAEGYDECLLCKMITRRKACIANLLIMHNHMQDNCYKLLIFKIIDKFRDRDDGLNMVKLLLERGIDINAINTSYMSVLGYACKYKCLNMVKLLLNRGANVNILVKYKTPLYCAAEGGSCEIGQLLIDKGAKIDAKFRSQESIIYHAITTKNEAFAMMLIKNGAKTNILPKDGKALINIALDWQQWSVVRLLIEYGADITTCDGYSQTVLQRMIALTRNFHTYIDDPKTLIYKLIDEKLNTT